jgi:hypothetical protein
MTSVGETELALLAARLRTRLDELVADYVERLAREAPEWTRERPELADTIAIGAREGIGAELDAMRAGRLPDACPELDAEGARNCARLGVPLDRVLLQYRLGHEVQWDAWLDAVERQQLAPAARRALLERVSRFLFAYAGRLSSFATAEYLRERERLLRGEEQRRAHLVREALAGRAVDEGRLGYALAGHHLAVVADGHDARTLVRELAGELDRRLLAVEAEEGVWWAWLGGDRPLGERARAPLRRLSPGAAVRLAVGDEGAGRDGFRASHAQALAARALGSAEGGAVVLFDDVALDALCTRDPDAAATFAARELRGIDGADARTAALRATLRAWFRAGQNAAAAAALLGVHEQTVAHRLRAVEERIGRPASARRAELEVALRLRERAAP